MSVSASEIREVIQEIRPAVASGWIQKISQPAPRVLVLEIRIPGKTVSLLLSADSETARIHVFSGKLPNPPTPPPFCQYLRAHIQGAAIDSIEQVSGDRVIRFRLSGREGACSLLAELTGRRATFLLLNSEDRVVAELDSDRGDLGRPYTPPAGQPRSDSTGEHAVENVRGTPEIGFPFPVSSRIEEAYRTRETELARTRMRLARLGFVRKGLKKTARRVEALREDLEKAARYKDYARYGELLKANLSQMKKGLDQIRVVDYFDQDLPELLVPLDPAKGPQGNMDDYFKKHRKYLTAEREIRPRLETTEREVDVLRKEYEALQAGTWEPPSTAASAPKSSKPSRALSSRPPSRSGPFRRFTSVDGLPIYVGRNARENEELTFKFAHSDDLWLHARGIPGSHVVVRLEKGSDPPPETIRDAATLGLLYSDLKKSGKGDVIFTRKKWVKKMKGQPPGTVSVTQEKSIFVTLDKTRLERLKERNE